VITLGSPHRGTAAVRGLVFIGPDAAEMHRRSSVLGELPLFGDSAPHANVVQVVGTRDWIVYPLSTSCPEGEVVCFEDLGHIGILTHRPAIEAVADALSTTVATRRPAAAARTSAARGR
jgi:hypothetical protein